MAPTILESNPQRSTVLRLSGTTRAFVIVDDEDDPVETLEYLWWLEPSGEMLPHVPFTGNTGSLVELEPDEKYLDQSLHCWVTDSQNGADSIEWEIELTESGS